MGDTRSINFLWLLRLRWGAALGQLTTIILVYALMRIALPLAPLLVLVGVAFASNAACVLWVRRPREVRDWMLGGLMALDIVLLTGLLYFSGGPFNPFSFLYLVHIALAAVVLPLRWTWALFTLAATCFAMLFVDHHWLPLDHAGDDEHPMRMHLEGMWVAFSVAAGFIVYFVHRVTRSLAEREQELQRVRELTAHSEKVASLATLAAGAAHELSTPLSTIAVIARELERSLDGRASAALEDVRLIRAEVQRCRRILEQMAVDAGARMAEKLLAVRVGALIDRIVASIDQRERIAIEVDAEARDSEVLIAPRAIELAMRGIIKNACEASEDGAEVVLRARLDGSSARFEVEDRGAGMSAEVLVRATEPFFTTKEPGRGMGLGLFLALAVAERLGGRLNVDSAVGRGTRVALLLPLGAGQMAALQETPAAAESLG